METLANGNSFSSGGSYAGVAAVTGWDPALPPLLYPDPMRGLRRETVC